MDLKEGGERFMEEFGGRKENNLKNKKNELQNHNTQL